MRDLEQEQILKDRMADRYTSAELCELLNIPVEDILNEFWEIVVQKAELFEEIFDGFEDDDDA